MKTVRNSDKKLLIVLAIVLAAAPVFAAVPLPGAAIGAHGCIDASAGWIRLVADELLRYC